ncbi:MAG: hypothetical protein LLG14_12200 [Nocardiaceae bacterium]|nr:hypothetical protein [Nocardiaceae bacterium]
MSERRAATISKETSHLSTVDRQEVDHEIAAKLTGAGDRKVRDLARATADRIDPDGAERRTRRAGRSSLSPPTRSRTAPRGSLRGCRSRRRWRFTARLLRLPRMRSRAGTRRAASAN